MLLRHGKINYVLGLEWAELDGGSAAQFVRDVAGTDTPVLFQTVGKRRSGQLIGYTTEVPPKEEGKGKKQPPKAYSLAGVLAQRGEDGIYVLELGSQAWYAVIQGGRLVRHGGEMLMPLREAVAVVTELSRELDIPVYGSGSHLPDAKPFTISDLDNAVRKAKPMELIAPGSGAGQALALGLVLVVVASMFYAGWYFLIRTPTPQMTPEQLAEQERQTYAQSMLASLPQMDADPTWIVEGARLNESYFPPMVSGWELDGIVCTPVQCGATYEISNERTSFSLSEIQDRFGVSHVRVDEPKRSVLVTLDRQPNPPGWGVPEVLNPPASTVSLVDVHGLIRLRIPAVLVEQTLHRESLSNGSQPAGVPGLAIETIKTMGEGAYPAPVLQRMTEVLAPLGFTPDLLEMSAPTGGRESGWQVRWVKVIKEN